MGASVSSMDGEWSSEMSGLGDMPESCVAAVLLYLDAPEICQVARLNRAFRGAAAADCVWTAKLPPNYEYLIGVASGGADEEVEEKRKRWEVVIKKEVYARLSRPNPFDGGTKEFWIEKTKGRVCVSISSKAMLIIGIDDRRYWSHLPTEESRFHFVAYLQQIWWLEVVGEIDFCFPAGTYSLFFRLHLGKPSRRIGRRVCITDNVHGWDIKPVQFQLSTSDDQRASSQYYLCEPGSWMLYHVGDFVVADSNELMKLKFSMTQIDCTHTKGGLCVDSVLICPKEYKQEKETIIHM